ncbi:hypothetical protein YK56LOC_35200 [Caballeronia sp. HLA56]
MRGQMAVSVLLESARPLHSITTQRGRSVVQEFLPDRSVTEDPGVLHPGAHFSECTHYCALTWRSLDGRA